MKKFTKFILTLIGIGTVIGGAFVYLKDKGYITVTSGGEDEDYDDFSTLDEEDTHRTYIKVDTEGLKARAKEIYENVRGEVKDKAEDAYAGAKRMVSDAKDSVANSLEKAWYKANDKVEEVEEFFTEDDVTVEE